MRPLVITFVIKRGQDRGLPQDYVHKGYFLLEDRKDFRTHVRAIPGAKRILGEKQWRLPATVDMIRELRPHLRAKTIVHSNLGTQEMLFQLGVQERLERKEHAEHKSKIDHALSIKRGADTPAKLPVKTSPFTHQRQAFSIGTTLDSVAFLMEQRTGKSLAAIAVVGHRVEHNDVKRVIIVCPNTATFVWEEQFEEHAAYPYNLVIGSAASVRSAKGIDKLFFNRLNSGPDIFVINFEALWSIRKYIKKWYPQLAIVDEMQRIKSRTAKCSKVCHALNKQATFRLGLTGTPLEDGPLDAWSQYRYVDPRIFAKKYADHESRYAVKGGFGGYEVIRFKNLKRFAKRLHSIAYRVKRADCFDMPPEADQPLYVELHKKTRKIYRELDKHMVATVNGRVLNVPNVLAKLTRCQQLVGGFLPDEDGTIHPVGSEKLDALRDFIEGFPRKKKLVVVARFRPEIEAIARLGEKLKIKTAKLYGKTKKPDRRLILKTFRKPEGPRLLVAQIQRVATTAVDFSAADTMVFYSPNFSSLDYDQMRSRLLGPKQKNPVTYVHLIARGTVDDITIYPALKKKMDVVRYLVDKLNPAHRKGVKMAKGKKHSKTKAPVLELPRSGDDDQVKRTVDELERKLSPKTQAGDSQMSKKEKHDNDDEVETQKKSKKVKDKAEKKAKAKPADDEDDGDMVSLSDIAAKVKVKPAELRKALRKSKIKKPEGSWRWPVGHADIKKVQKLAKDLK